MTFLMGAKVFFLFPTVMAQKSGSAAWISLLVSTALGLLGLWGWVLWIRATGDLSFVASLRLTVGRVLGDLLAVCLAVALTMLTAWSIRVFAGGAVIGLVPDFPIDVLLMISAVSAVYAAWLGPEPVARVALIFFAPTLLSMTLVMLGMYRSFSLSNLLPLWGLGAKTTLVQGVVNAGAFGALPALAVMKSLVRKTRDLGRSGLKSILLASAIMVTGSIAIGGIFPYPMSTRMVYPLGTLARAIYLGRFLQRFEALFAFTWFFAASVQTSFSYLVILILLAQVSNTHTYRPFVPGIVTLIFGIAGLPANTLRTGQLVDSFFTTRAGNFTLALGWMLYLAARLRGVSARGSERQPGAGEKGADGAGTAGENEQ